MLAHMQVTTSTDSLTSLYAIGPIDSRHLLTQQARLSDGQKIALLVPTHLSLSVLNDPQFKDGYEWGYFESDIEEEWTIPHMVNHIYITLRTELLREGGSSTSAWVVGFLLGGLASLAETVRTLAGVGIAHLCFLLSGIPFDRSSCNRYSALFHIDALHKAALRAYRARVRLYRGQGKSWSDAQRLALVGSAQ